MRRHPNKRLLNLGERKELCLRSGVLSSKTDTFEQLCELVLLEDFKKSVPEKSCAAFKRAEGNHTCRGRGIS